MTQLALPLRLDAHAAFETLVDGVNLTAFAHVRALTEAARGEVLWLWGTRGCGKSHVLQAACRAADQAGKRAMYLPLGGGSDSGPGNSADMGIDPGSLADLDALDFLALDQVDRVAGLPEWEASLFAVLNGFQSRERTLLMAAENVPSALAFALPDLASRAAGAIVYRVHALDDDDQVRALCLHAHHRGLVLDAPAARFLQSRVPRDMPALCAWLSRLDTASLAAQRRITVPFIREALASDQALE